MSRSGTASTDASLTIEAGAATWAADGAAREKVDLWAELQHPSRQAVDLSAYSGVTFDAQLSGGRAATLTLTFDAAGDYDAAESATERQRFDVTAEWSTHQLLFSEIGYAANAMKTIDFIVGAQPAPVVLKIRNLNLLCSEACP